MSETKNWKRLIFTLFIFKRRHIIIPDIIFALEQQQTIESNLRRFLSPTSFLMRLELALNNFHAACMKHA
jgi:hypothetical protein